MKKSELIKKLADLKAKQQMLDSAWKKAGNREFVQYIVDILPKVVDAERCSIFILDSSDSDVWILCGTGVREREFDVPIKTSIVGKVISSGKFSLDNDLQHKVGPHDVIGVRTGFTVHQSLCVPIRGVSTDKVTGAVQALNKVSGGFTDQDRQILERTALHLQVNVENIYLRQESQRISAELGKTIEMLEARLRKHEALKSGENPIPKKPE